MVVGNEYAEWPGNVLLGGFETAALGNENDGAIAAAEGALNDAFGDGEPEDDADELAVFVGSANGFGALTALPKLPNALGVLAPNGFFVCTCLTQGLVPYFA